MSTLPKTPERWTLTYSGREHSVDVSDAGLRRLLVWCVDGVEVARVRTSDNRVVLDGEDHGAIGVRLPSLAGPARRVTLYDPSSELGAVTSAHAGVGGVDFDPVPGSAAARREAWIRAHPRRHTFRRGGGAALGLIGPLVLVWLWRRLGLSLPDWSLPLPRIPWPDVPWPDLPDIPWPNWSLPDLPDLPGVPPWGGEAARYLGPVLIAVGVATGATMSRFAFLRSLWRKPPSQCSKLV